MKRIVALLMALVMVLSLAACGKEAPAPVETTAPAATAAPAEVVPETTEAVPETTEAVPETTGAADEGRPVTLGRLENGVYINDYIGIGCAMGDGWTFRTAEELQELPGQIQDLLQDTEYSESVLRQITDMMADNADTLTSVNIQYTKLSLQERFSYATLSDEELVEVVLQESASVEDIYAQAGIEGATMEKVTVNFLGQERYAIYTSATIQGYPYYMLQIMDYGLGQYGVTITFSSFFEDNTASALDLFYALD